MDLAAMALKNLDRDEDQLKVIEASGDARLLVEAGPGTGKTAVACARLAYLIREEDVDPCNTWMISFTRTAVAEIRARLHSYVGNASFAIRMATLDSHAWAIHSGHDADARLGGDYEENIERVIELLKTDEDVAEELSRLEHLVIDEAQDIVGQRADLIELLIKRLPEHCGVTVFADEAQAIYGFSDDEIEGGAGIAALPGESLLERLRAANELRFIKQSLCTIHRTSSQGLVKIFSELRREVLDPKNRSTGAQARTAQRIKDLADRSGLEWREMKIADFGADDLILFRRRAEVLMASQFCDRPHRLRLSGYGATVPSWLALCFFDFTEPFLSEQNFQELWSSRVGIKAEYGPGEAWDRLLRVAGRKDGAIEMRKLRQRLSRPRPPVDLSTVEHGLPGPIAGTIHASKGREADKVTLVLPNGGDFKSVDHETEEARVLFVGATRAKTVLSVASGLKSKGATLRSNRAYSWTYSGKAMVEIGRQGDISPRGFVGQSEFELADATKAQDILAEAVDVVSTYSLRADPNHEWRYRIHLGYEGPCIGILTRKVNDDFWEILGNWNKRDTHRLPFSIPYVRGHGCSTLVLAPDDPGLSALHEPWASSGFILAPMISAFPTVKFGLKK